MPPSALFGLSGGVIALVTVVVALGVVVPALVRIGWGRWHARYPAVEPDPSAVRRRFQSFSVGLVNLGYCVHVAVDERNLHLTPVGVVRPFGLRAVSIPWGEISVTGTLPFGRRSATIGGVGVVGPAWCLDLARGTGPAPGRRG